MGKKVTFMLATVLTAAMMAVGCSSSDAEEQAVEAETTADETPPTTESTTTTTEPTTTTSEPATTTTSGPQVADLRLLALDVEDVGESFEAIAVNSAVALTDHLLTPCGNAMSSSDLQRTASIYAYPGEALGWPDPPAVITAVVTAQQIIGDNTFVADVESAAGSCPPFFEWPINDTTANAAGQAIEVATVDEVVGTGYVAVLDDGSVMLQYALSVDDLAMTLHFIGYGPEFELVQALTTPVVEAAQRKLAECLTVDACRDYNG